MKHLSLMLVLACCTVSAAEVAEDQLQRQILDIAKQLRCAVCQNQPISESQAELASDMRAIIGEQLRAGKSQDEIIAYFVARYGDYVLLKPPMDRAGAPVWLLPPVLLLVIGFFAMWFIRQRLRRPTPPAAELSDADRARVQAVRGRD